jgi:hypothetical protein
VADVAVNRRGAVELSVIQYVEGFQPELDPRRFAQSHALCQSHVEILDAGALEESSRRCPGLAQTGQTEERRVESALANTRIRVNLL